MDEFELLLLLGLGVVAALLLSGAGGTAAAIAPVPAPDQGGDSAASWYGNVTATVTSADVDTLARTAYGEARGAGAAAMQGVCSVVMNRVRAGHFPGGGSVTGVCRAPNQFSCWNWGDPNRAVILSVTSSNVIFQQCLQLAQAAVDGSLPDNTGGALYYHDGSIGTPAGWGQVERTASIGGLEFFA